MKKITVISISTIVLLSTIIIQSAHAQNDLRRMEITQVSAPAQGVAVFLDYTDKAVVVIESPITTLRFSSNVSGIVREMHEPEQGRYVLIIEPYTQILVIDSPGFIQQRQRIGNPQAREVRYFEIKPETQASNLISVIFNVTPTDAKLFVDGQETGINTTVQVNAGESELRIERTGYRAIEDIVNFSPENISFNYNLERINQEVLRIRTNPGDATVTIDDIEIGRTDNNGILERFYFPGTYRLQVTKSGYLMEHLQIEVTEDGVNTFNIDLESNLSTLSLELEPDDAEVFVNRQKYVLLTNIVLPPGMHRLEIRKEGYEPLIENIELERNITLEKKVILTPYKGELLVSTTPSDARVELKNKNGITVDSWVGIRRINNLPVGRYTVKIMADGYGTLEQIVEIIIDQVSEIHLNVERVSDNNILAKVEDSDTSINKKFFAGFGYSWYDNAFGADGKGLTLVLGYRINRIVGLKFSGSNYGSFSENYRSWDLSILSNFVLFQSKYFDYSISLGMNLTDWVETGYEWNNYAWNNPGMVSISNNYIEVGAVIASGVNLNISRSISLYGDVYSIISNRGMTRIGSSDFRSTIQTIFGIKLKI